VGTKETVATATALEMAMETAKVTAGDVGGGSGNTAIAATATAMTGVEVGGGDDVNPGSNYILILIPSFVGRFMQPIIYTNNGWGVV